MSNAPFQLQRDSFGRLVLTAADGERHEGVTPVRAFPIAAPDEGISLINYEGHEVGRPAARHRRADRGRTGQPRVCPGDRTDRRRLQLRLPEYLATDHQPRPGRADPEGRRRHPSPLPDPPADCRQPRHPVPGSRPEPARPPEPQISGSFPLEAVRDLLFVMQTPPQPSP